jgi:hypothetical protein
MAAHILIVSPIPSHPQDQGNSARIYALGRLLQSAGLIVHFLYSQLEGLTPEQQWAMEESWDYFHSIPHSGRSMAATGPGYFRLDDWWQPEVAALAQSLHRRWRFRAVIANYVWFSAVLDAFGDDVLKVLDTHDVFGGRDQRFRDIGLEPEWFYTTEAEEARGLARADIVLAIQDDEAAQFRALGHSDVRVLGHMVGQRRRMPRPLDGRPVSIGYLASGNPLNVESFVRLRRALPSAPPPGLRFVVAGALCHRLSDLGPFEALGRIDHVDGFYDQVDLVVNPMTAGTGLKIKSVEAVFEGLPLIATRAAMVGLPVLHPWHELETGEDVANCLLQERLDAAALQSLTTASIACAEAYARTVRAEVVQLVESIAA